CAGMLVSWALYHYGPPLPEAVRPKADTTDSRSPEANSAASESAGVAVAARSQAAGDARRTDQKPSAAGAVPTTGSIGAPPLRMPLEGVSPEAMKGGFAEKRGSRPHEAADLL